MITNVNIRQTENGYFVNYHEDGKSKDRVHHTWKDLCDWMLTKVESQARS
jgi:hypothetical protein